MARPRKVNFQPPAKTVTAVELAFKQLVALHVVGDEVDECTQILTDAVKNNLWRQVESVIDKMKKTTAKTPFSMVSKGHDWNSMNMANYDEEEEWSGYDIKYPKTVAKPYSFKNVINWQQLVNELVSETKEYSVPANELMSLIKSHTMQKLIYDEFVAVINQIHPGDPINDYIMDESAKDFVANNIDDSGDSQGYNIRFYISIVNAAVSLKPIDDFGLLFDFTYTVKVEGVWPGEGFRYNHAYGF